MRPEDIDRFENYVKSNKVNKTKKDKEKAKSLFSRANTKFNNMEKLGITKETATDYYEKLGDEFKKIVSKNRL